jgi:hypothetical protein
MKKYENLLPTFKVIRESHIEKDDFAIKIIKYLPIITLCCLGIGILNLKICYFLFNIDILAYVEVNEIIFETFTNLLVCLIFFLGQAALAELFTFFRYRLLKITKSTDKRIKSGITFSLKTLHITYFFIVITITGFFWGYINLIDNDKMKVIHKELMFFGISMYVINLILLTFVFYVDLIFKTIYFRSFNAKFNIVLKAVYFALFYTVLNSVNSVAHIKILSTYGTYIKIGNNKIISTQDYYYIGRTKNYVFFYDVLKESTDVYQNKDITVLSLSTKGFSETVKVKLDTGKKKLDWEKRKLIDSLILKND